MNLIVSNRIDLQIVYPNLRENLKKIIYKFMVENEQTSKKNILSLIEMEMAYMNTNNLNFRYAFEDDLKMFAIRTINLNF